MSTIPEGYKLIIVDEDSVMADEIELGGFDLSKSFARAYVMNEIVDTITRHESITYAD